MLSFFSSRRNWDSPTPHPQASVPHPQANVPPPTLWFRGRVTLAGERGVGRVPIPTRGHTYTVVLFLCTYFVVTSMDVHKNAHGTQMKTILSSVVAVVKGSSSHTLSDYKATFVCLCFLLMFLLSVWQELGEP